MKLTELNSNDEIADIRAWMDQIKVTFDKFTYQIRLDKGEYKIYVDGDIAIDKTILKNGKLPYKFAEVKGRFNIAASELIDLENCPESVGSFICFDNDISTLQGCPKFCTDRFATFDIGGCNKLNSFIGVANYIEEIGQCLNFKPSLIDRGGLGLILIKKLEMFTFTGFSSEQRKKPFTIINKYLCKPDRIFECQQELIEAGFEEYAQL